MTHHRGRTALASYNKINIQSGVEAASPYRLIQMLLEGALARISTAVGQIKRREIADKGRNIGLAISIIDGLRASLDREQGEDLVVNLERLYDYMSRRLLEANLHDDIAKLEEVHGLLREIKAGWDGIPAKLVVEEKARRAADPVPAASVVAQGAR